MSYEQLRRHSIGLALLCAILLWPGLLWALRGDVTGDGKITVADAILSLQIMDLAAPAGQEIRLAADANGDGKIGLDEAIYALQAISGVRATPLGIIALSPVDGAAGVAANAIIAARFNQTVDASTVNAATVTLKDAANQPVAGSVYSNGVTVQLIPAASLAAGVYTATISTGVRDPAGNPLAGGFSWTFTASGIPAPSGQLDTSYGLAGDGTVTVSFGGTEHEARAVALQPDGRAVVGGFAEVAGVRKFALLRLDADGRLDASFGMNGIATTSFDTSSWDIINGIAVQPDGKIVAAGGYNAFALARYNPDGSLDNGFGFRGTVRTEVSQSAAYSVALQPDGKIVAGGWSMSTGASDGGPYGARFALVRYNPDGSLDPAFGAGGIARTLVAGKAAVIWAIALQPDGKIVAAGNAYDGAGNVFALARFNADGTVDPSFGTDGAVLFPMVEGQEEVCYGLGLQPDGAIVAAGETVAHPSYNAAGDAAIIRLTPQGAPDPGFGSGSRVITDYESVDNRARGLAIQLDGRIVVAGFAFNRGVLLIRYNPDGSLDTTFGNGAKTATNTGDLSMAHALAIQDDGRIVAVGFSNVPKEFAVGRFLP